MGAEWGKKIGAQKESKTMGCDNITKNWKVMTGHKL